MKLFRKVAVIGVGLIGGSIALAIRKKGLAGRIVGVSRRQESLRIAKSRGVVDEGSRQLDIIKDADLLILAAPVDTIISFAPKISLLIKKDCIITDVGSTKEKIVSAFEKKFSNFVGSHPLAGSEKRSVRHASLGIFRDSLCILTPTRKTNARALNSVKMLWKNIGVETILLDPKMHDKILSLTSHLPHLIAFSLVNIIPKEYLKLSSSGLRDATRIAASEPELWSAIFLSNQKNTLNSIKLFKAGLSRIESALKKKDKRQLSEILEKAKKKREMFSQL